MPPSTIDTLPLLTRSLIYARSFELGIMPAVPGDDVRSVLAQLPPLEARTARRKFRKAWKRALKKHVKVYPRSSHFRQRMEGEALSPSAFPDGKAMAMRKHLVFAEIMTNVDATVRRYDTQL